ncbi:MAG: polysaccharide pyruvyl transferase family protein [Lactobacillus sp.]|nr:polysaccharide pyruvyl transferase family protein [Lactobacillus sp.]
MKVGILTFSAAHNFGAILQCYGLYKTICSLGHSVEVIDYRPDYLAASKPAFGWRQYLSRHFETLYARYSEYRYWRNIYDGYMAFKRKNMAMSAPVYDNTGLKTLVERYDIVVIGSDQIWNNRFNGRDMAWYGAISDRVRWITYAASAGNVDDWAKWAAQQTELLSHFENISARESELADFVGTITGTQIPAVLDPSLLGNPDIWAQWRQPMIKEDYILTYQARESDDLFRIAENLKHQLGCKRIIPLDFYGNVKKMGHETFVASPGEFISLIANARCVVTTSFHGTAFSIILNTPFYTIRLNDGADGRSLNLLQATGLDNRMIECDDNPVFEPVNFADACERLSSLRKESLEFLRGSLS